MIQIVIGILVIIGWYAHIPAIIQLRPTLPPMQYNTALCIALSGAGLCARHWGRRRLALALGGGVAIFTGLTLYEYLTGFNAGIDQLFFHPYITTLTSQPGRMSPAAGCCLFLTGVALLLDSAQAGRKWRPALIGSLGSMVVTICVVAIIGYTIDLPGTYGWGELTRIAPHTAFCNSLLGVGIFFLAWPEGRKRGEPMPHWLPVPVGLAVLAASVVFFQALASKQNQEIASAIKASGDGATNTLYVRVEARIRSLVRMAQRWEFSGRPAQPAWEDDANNYIHDFPDLQAIEWIDSGRLVRWIAPLAGNESKLNQNLVQEQRRWTAAAAAEQSHEAAVTHAVELFHGGAGFIIYIPIYVHENFDGWIAGVFKSQAIFERYFPDTVLSGYSINISDGAELFQRGSTQKPSQPNWIFTSRIEMRGTTWTVRVCPTPQLLNKMNSQLPGMVLLAGFALSLLMALCVYLAQRASSHERRTAGLNRELRAALDEVQTLSGLLPICAGCKRIRDDGGYWNQIERYISRHSAASFSHGICPECAIKFYESEGMEVPEEVLKAAEKRNYD